MHGVDLPLGADRGGPFAAATVGGSSPFRRSPARHGLLCRSKCLAEESPPSLGMAGHIKRAITHVPEDGARLDEPEEECGDGLRIDVGPYLSVGLSLLDDRGHLVEIFPNTGEHPRPAIPPSSISLLRKDDAGERAVVPDHSEVPHQE